RRPLQRVGEVAVADFQLVEEAHVLDGNDGLVSEGLEERHLTIREQVHLTSAQLDRTDGRALPHQGNHEYGAEAHPARVLAAVGELVRTGLHIRDMDGLVLEYGVAGRGSARERERERAAPPDEKGAGLGD